MKWIVTMLHPFASKRVPSEDIKKKIHSILRNREIEIYYPCHEDEDGNKIDDPHNDYIFIEFLDSVNYNKLEEDEFFHLILRSPQGVFHFLSPDEVFQLTPPERTNPVLEKGQRVVIRKGAYKGHQGIVESVSEETAQVEILSGDCPVDAVFPLHWVRLKV